MKRVIVNRNASGQPIFARIEHALNSVGITFTEDAPFPEEACFSIDDSYFPQARAIFEKLKEDGIIENFTVEEK